jgi:hypothetical protein
MTQVFRYVCSLFLLVAVLFIYIYIRVLFRDTSVKMDSTRPKMRGVLFLKTHKTGGSTIGAIFARKCLRNRLNCFVPPSAHAGRTWNLDNSRDWGTIRRSQGLFGGLGYPYSIWFHHVMASKRVATLVYNFSGPIVTVVRNPAARFRSAWGWYEHGSDKSNVTHSAHLSMNLTTFAQRAATEPAWLRSIQPKFKYRTGLDSTSEELIGTRPSRFRDPGSFRRRFGALLQRIDPWNDEQQPSQLPLLRRRQQFMPIVLERLDESLVVLAQALGWPLSDFLYKHLKENEQLRDSVPSPELERALWHLQPYDSRLYNASVAALERRIKLYGPAFPVDLAIFRSKLKALNTQCTISAEESESGLCSELSLDNVAYVKAATKGFG